MQSADAGKKKAAKSARFVSFREEDGSFRFRLLAADGEQLLLSRSFADGKSSGLVTKRLQDGSALDIRNDGSSYGLWLDGEAVGQGGEFTDANARDAAVQRLREALAPQD